jgi:hypothetical protein
MRSLLDVLLKQLTLLPIVVESVQKGGRRLRHQIALNTKEGHAIDNTRTLRALLGRQAPSPVEPARNRGKKQKGHPGERA